MPCGVAKKKKKTQNRGKGTDLEKRGSGSGCPEGDEESKQSSGIRGVRGTCQAGCSLGTRRHRSGVEERVKLRDISTQNLKVPIATLPFPFGSVSGNLSPRHTWT